MCACSPVSRSYPGLHREAWLLHILQGMLCINFRVIFNMLIPETASCSSRRAFCQKGFAKDMFS